MSPIMAADLFTPGWVRLLYGRSNIIVSANFSINLNWLEVFPLEIKGEIDQSNHHGDFNQGTDYRGKCFPGVNPENCYGYGYSKFEIVAGRREGEGSGLLVTGPHFFTHKKRKHKHYHEVDEQGDGNNHHIHGNFDNVFTFKGEHDDNGKEQRYECEGAYDGNKSFVIPLFTLYPDQHESGQKACNKGDAEIDEHAFGDLPDGNINFKGLKAKKSGQYGQKDPCVDRKKQYLENGVEGYQSCCILRVAFGKIVPDNDHGDAPCQTDEDQARHVMGIMLKEEHPQPEHEQWSYNPVLEK